MNIEELRKRTSLRTWERGGNYFRERRVSFHSFYQDIAAFNVRGSELYSVKLFLSPDKNNIIDGTCSCPAGGICKHIVASALALMTQSGMVINHSQSAIREKNELSIHEISRLSRFLKRNNFPFNMVYNFEKDPEKGIIAIFNDVEAEEPGLAEEFVYDMSEYFRYENRFISEWISARFDTWKKIPKPEKDKSQIEKERLLSRNSDIYNGFVNSLGINHGQYQSGSNENIIPGNPSFAIFIKPVNSYGGYFTFEQRFIVQLLFDKGDRKYLIIENPSLFLEEIAGTGLLTAGRSSFKMPMKTIQDPILLKLARFFSTMSSSKYSYRDYENLISLNSIYELCEDGIFCFYNNKKSALALAKETADLNITLDYINKQIVLSWVILIGQNRITKENDPQILPGKPPMILSNNTLYLFSSMLSIPLIKNIERNSRLQMTSYDLRRFHEAFVEPRMADCKIEIMSGYKKGLDEAESFKVNLVFDHSEKTGTIVDVKFDYNGSTYAPLLTQITEKSFEPYKVAKKTTRDLKGEHEFMKKIIGPFGVNINGNLIIRPDKEEAAAELALFTMQNNPHVKDVSLTDAFMSQLKVNRPDVSVNVEPSGIDFLDVSFSLGKDIPQSEIPLILDALRNGKKTFRLPNNSIIILDPEDFKEVFAILDALEGRKGLEEGKPVRLTRADMLYLANRLDEESNVLPAKLRDEVTARLESFDAYEPPESPKELKGTLRGYQLTGFHWLHKMSTHGFHSILADDMGLGKTIQTITLLLKFYEADHAGVLPPSIIVCPATLVYNWMAEFSKFSPNLKAVPLYGNKMDREATLKDKSFRVFVTSYSTMQRDIDEIVKTPFLFAVLDEAHKIKNRSTQTFKGSRLIQAQHRLALTGTPVENRTEDLLSLFEFLEPGFLSLYRKKTDNPAEQKGNPLKKRVSPFILRRLKSQVLDDLPAKTEQIMFCELEDKQKKLYLALREQSSIAAGNIIREKGIDRSKIHILALLTRLKQVCCHPALLDSQKGQPIPSAKLDLLLELLEEVKDGGHRALVFSQFTSMLSIIREQLEQNGFSCLYMDGETKGRLELTNKFNQDPSISCFLISLKTGGHGLNLTGADTVIHYDQWWNPAVEAQATDRVHRIGQTKAVTVYKLICKQTIEEKILELQKRKKELFADLIDENSVGSLSLTAEDITAMLCD